MIETRDDGIRAEPGVSGDDGASHARFSLFNLPAFRFFFVPVLLLLAVLTAAAVLVILQNGGNSAWKGIDPPPGTRIIDAGHYRIRLSDADETHYAAFRLGLAVIKADGGAQGAVNKGRGALARMVSNTIGALEKIYLDESLERRVLAETFRDRFNRALGREVIRAVYFGDFTLD